MKNKIREVLKERGLTQKEVAQAIGMTDMGFSKACDGSATQGTIDKVAKFLNMESSDLLDEKLPIARYEGVLTIGETLLDVAVLDDKRRVITQAAVFKALDRPARGNSRVINIPVFMDASNLQAFIDEELMSMTNKIRYIDLKGRYQESYDAKILPLVSDLYLKARDAGVIKLPSQLATAKKAEMLVRSLAKVGIIALIDEATGYNKAKNHAKDELQKFLSQFLREEAARWVKTFPDTFFEDIYKMRGWNWNNTSSRPGIVGNIIKDIVYDRLVPMVRSELELRNPKNENGNRSHRHHQYLTEIGKTRLNGHLEALHALANVAGHNWVKFMDYVDKAYPRQHQQWSLFDPEDFD